VAKLYVTYSFEVAGKPGTGRVVVSPCISEQLTEKDLAQIEQSIRELNPEHENVFLLWWKLLADETSIPK
jgi:hypothetical protein